MKLTFGPDDDEAFHRTTKTLLRQFAAWLKTEGGISADEAELTADDASLALDWKWGYSDGDLGRWRPDDVREFLLDWCPRKLSMSPDDAAPIPSALSLFVGFLDDQRLLSKGSAPAAEVQRAIDAVTGEFVAAMGNADNFGLAKSLFAGGLASGFDLDTPEQIEQWMDEFNSLPDDERRRMLPDHLFGARDEPDAPSLPPVAMPDDTAVATSRAEAPVLHAFARLAEFVGKGRKLTQTGRLTLADARALVELLDTGDRMDEQIGDRTFKTTSSADLPRLSLLFKWAKAAGVLRVTKGQVVATKAGLALAGDPTPMFDRATDALLKMGALKSQRDPDWWMAWPDVDDLLDQAASLLLSLPYLTQEPMPLDELVEVAARVVLEEFEFKMDDAGVTRLVARDVTDMVDAFELAGLVRRSDYDEPKDKWARQRSGGQVEITPAGTVGVRRVLQNEGFDAPVAGAHADGSAHDLLLATDVDEFATFSAEFTAWRNRRTPEEAAVSLGAAIESLDDMALVNLAFAMLADVGIDVAEPVVSQFLERSDRRGFARCWLVDHGFLDERELYDTDDVFAFTDVLAHRVAIGGPDALVAALALAGNHDEQVKVIDQLWRGPSTATDIVLLAIGETHPTKVVAKAARKAGFKRRSLTN